MTKYEWERELKRHIAVLPKSEQARIFDYYGEIFEDRIEAGMRENDIIYEFGNPFDVAQKILADYRLDDTETVRPPRFRPQRECETNAADHAPPSEPDLPPPPQDVRQTANFDHPPVHESQKTSGNWFGRFMLMFVLYLFLGIPALIVLIAVAAVGIALSIACVAMIAWGFANTVYWVVQLIIAAGGASAVALAGIGLLSAGIGFVFVTPCAKLAKYLAIGVGKMIQSTFRFISGKKAVKV